MLSDMEHVLDREIKLRYITDNEFIKSMAEKNAPKHSIDSLLKMFHYYNNGDFDYNNGDFGGSPFVTAAILKRMPTTFNEFLKKELK